MFIPSLQRRVPRRLLERDPSQVERLLLYGRYYKTVMGRDRYEYNLAKQLMPGGAMNIIKRARRRQRPLTVIAPSKVAIFGT